MNLKFDKRGNKRLRCEAVIWHDNLLPDIFYNAKMHNISKSGVYFESDQIIYPGEDIYVGLKNSTSPTYSTKPASTSRKRTCSGSAKRSPGWLTVEN